MINFTKKMLSAILTICVIVGAFAVFSTVTFAADAVSVTIESFVRGEQTDLISSELLVAKVEGYDGNVHDLVYEWENRNVNCFISQNYIFYMVFIETYFKKVGIFVYKKHFSKLSSSRFDYSFYK